MKCIDPETMTPADRLAELGEILAAGIQRFLAAESKAVLHPENRDEQVDALGAVEAPCRAPTEPTA